jgi:hypothetical protein
MTPITWRGRDSHPSMIDIHRNAHREHWQAARSSLDLPEHLLQRSFVRIVRRERYPQQVAKLTIRLPQTIPSANVRTHGINVRRLRRF